MLQQLKNSIRDHATNARGWRTGRKIIIIESDDWGGIRLPEAGILQQLKDLGIKTERDPMLQNDALASEEDLQKLFDTLNSIPRRTEFAAPFCYGKYNRCQPKFRKN